MYCIVIKGPSLKEIRSQFTLALKEASLIELRIDFWDEEGVKALPELIKEFPGQKIITLRPVSQGGGFKGDENSRLKKIRELAGLKPDYIDLEFFLDDDFINDIRRRSSSKIIISYHNFEKMPELLSIWEEITKKPADFYKISAQLASSEEALAMLNFQKGKDHLLTMGMGVFGPITRILGPYFGVPWIYASLDQMNATAPGQVDIGELKLFYSHYFEKIYGLIGNPIDRSIGHRFHNQIMRKLKAIYVKFPVDKDQLEGFIHEAKRSGIRGLSVTMPLKEAILPYLDEIDPWSNKVGAVNTLIFEQGKIKGFNTDGKGALDAIEEKIKVEGKKIVIIGAGGASKAVIQESLDRNVHVILVARNFEQGKIIAAKFKCEIARLDEMERLFQEGYDVLINSTPNPMPIDPKWICPHAVVMDMDIEISPLLLAAKEKGCQIVYGSEMFRNQALAQLKLWFKSDFED